MFWLSRPPYLRWIAGSLLIVGSLVAELWPSATVPHPFAAREIAAGEEISPLDVTWVEVPRDLLPIVELPIVAGRKLLAGDPILPSSASPEGSIPSGWWAVEMPVPASATRGQQVRVVVASDVYEAPPFESVGIVIETLAGDAFGQPVGLVALPENATSTIALGLVEGRVIVLLGS